MRRWLVLALVPAALFAVHMVGVAVLVVPFGGTSETVAYGVLYAVEVALVATIAARVGRSRPMSRRSASPCWARPSPGWRPASAGSLRSWPSSGGPR